MTRDECLKALDDLNYRYASNHGDDDDAWPTDARDAFASQSRTLLDSIDRPTEPTVDSEGAANALVRIRIYGAPSHGLPTNVDTGDFDLARVQAQWERQLAHLLGQWKGITADQVREIADRVRAAVNNNDVAAIAALSVSTQAAAVALISAMNDMAQQAAEEVIREARAQGVHAHEMAPIPGRGSWLAAVAIATATLLGNGLANAGAREALRRFSPGASGDAVAGAVSEHLSSLSDAFLRDNLGNALTAAQNDGRIETLLAGPVTAFYGSERMDSRTCPPCERIDGKWLGNSDNPDTPGIINRVYPSGGYVNCEGGPRCRGTVIGVYRPKQVEADHGSD